MQNALHWSRMLGDVLRATCYIPFEGSKAADIAIDCLQHEALV